MSPVPIMAPVYSGSLQPKKKYELQEIALALRLSGQGTKDDLVQRITKHLDMRQDELEEHPTFTGLYSRRKRSVQPQPLLSSRVEVPEKPQSSARRPITLDPIMETTPAKELRAISTSLKHSHSPDNNHSNQPFRAITSPAKSLIERLQHVPVQSVVRQFRYQDILQGGNEAVLFLRSFMSNSRNIWFVTAIFELFYILWTIIPWQNFEITLFKGHGQTIFLYYPPLAVFQTSTFWLVLLHWSLPTFLIPALFGSLIIFNFAHSPSGPYVEGSPITHLDPLTASIMRLAAHIIYPYSSIASDTGILGLDVLGSNWRILGASIGLAFSFAEAIAGAPLVLTGTAIKRTPRQLEAGGDLPSLRAITANEETTPSDSEID